MPSAVPTAAPGVAAPASPGLTGDAADPTSTNWWRRKFGSRPVRVLAPMVDQSELPFRSLCRAHGTDLCYTPMISAKQFVASEAYREVAFGVQDGVEAYDRPLVVQFAGHDPATLLAAAKHVEHRCDAVDLNLGCPQKIARRGRYGSFLLDEPKLVSEIVSTLHSHLECPVVCKIRLLPNASETADFARMLVGCGASVIAVHGRTREQKGAAQGAADWSRIAAVKAAVGSTPVLANGGVFTADDVERCLEATGALGR